MTGLLEGRRALVTGGAACDASKTAPKFALMGGSPFRVIYFNKEER